MSLGTDSMLRLLDFICAAARAGRPAPKLREMTAVLGLDTPGGNITYALRELERQGAIGVEREGTRRRYTDIASGARTGWTDVSRRDRASIEAAVLGAIRERAAAGAAAPSLTVLSNLADCSEPVVRAALARLMKAGALERERAGSNAVRYRLQGGPWTGWSGREKAGAGARPKAKRPCMSCRRPFESEGIHNRLCPSCKQLASNASPLLVQEYGVGG